MMTNFKKALANKGFVVGGCIFLAIALIARSSVRWCGRLIPMRRR